jgi:hypothetical protein
MRIMGAAEGAIIIGIMPMPQSPPGMMPASHWKCPPSSRTEISAWHCWHVLCPKSFQLRDQLLPFLDRLQPPPQHSDHEALILLLPPRNAAPTQALQLPVRIRNPTIAISDGL